jgi:RimJ/RimL family protein N-acetyltransferase
VSGPDAYFLTTERLGFRCWSSADFDLANALWGDPKVAALIGGPFGPEEVEERLQREIACMAANGVQYWPVFLRSRGAHAGCAGLRPYRSEDRIYELGFHLRPEHWGRGLAEEAGRALIRYAFETIGAKALFAGHHPENHASRRVLAKLGFRLTHEEFYAPTGLMHPSYLLERLT